MNQCFFFWGEILPFFHKEIGNSFEIFRFSSVSSTNFAKFLVKICQNLNKKSGKRKTLQSTPNTYRSNNLFKWFSTEYLHHVKFIKIFGIEKQADCVALHFNHVSFEFSFDEPNCFELCAIYLSHKQQNYTTSETVIEASVKLMTSSTFVITSFRNDCDYDKWRPASYLNKGAKVQQTTLESGFWTLFMWSPQPNIMLVPSSSKIQPPSVSSKSLCSHI